MQVHLSKRIIIHTLPNSSYTQDSPESCSRWTPDSGGLKSNFFRFLLFFQTVPKQNGHAWTFLGARHTMCEDGPDWSKNSAGTFDCVGLIFTVILCIVKRDILLHQDKSWSELGDWCPWVVFRGLACQIAYFNTFTQ